MVIVAAVKAPDLTLRSNRVKPTHEQRAHGWRGWLTIEGKFGRLRGWSGIGIAVFPWLGNEDDRALPGDCLAIAHLEICTTGTA